MKYISMVSMVLASSLLSMSCSRSEAVSETKEGIDLNNSFGQLGGFESLTYQELIKTTKVETGALPWTDTYWPLTEKGLSRRWSKSDKPIGLAEFFTTQTEQNKAQTLDPNLSPADKYDILYRWRHNKLLNETANAETMKSWELLDTQLDMSAELSASRALVKTTSSYFRSATNADFRKQFPMSSDGWSSYLYYTSADKYMFLDQEGSGEDWSWMGSCHGWAPAAFMAETPKHAVLAKFDDRQVLVTEGDIRGLLTKSWADHSPSNEQYFVGRRCETNLADPEGEIPSDQNGRGYYGQIIRGEAKTPFFVKSEKFGMASISSGRIYPISYTSEGGVDAYLLETTKSSQKSYVIAKSLDAVIAYRQSGDRTGIEDLSSNVEMFGCWDVNPATMHLALLEKIGKEKLGLVMDRTQTGQVWNQPVFEASFTFGEKVPLSKSRPAVRAVNTSYMMNVQAEVKWISEPAEQQMHYSTAFNKKHVMTSKYNYVLEFDRLDHLIGGDWGNLVQEPTVDEKPGLWKQDPTLSKVTPDFIYGFTKGSLPVDDVANGFDYSGIIGKIHACSLAEKTDGKMKVGTQELTYANCDLSKVTP